ncbi:MAG: SMC-Scp complex subunit ScpB [Lachnospiraceae bacterium]|nr:SMC-Scp complex subunit ScpB [Lachnospiraceae bacterium]
MEQDKLEAVIEAVLFTMGSAVEIKRLAEVTGEEEAAVEQAVAGLKKKYEKRNSGLMLIMLENAVQLCTKSELFEYLVKVARVPKNYVLSDTAIETLSIIAYKQPVTRLQIEHIRGVDCSHAVNRLLEYGLIEERGRLNAPGRPILFGTTEQFLRSFGLNSIEDLPQLDSAEVEDFRAQAEAEASSALGETLNVEV